MDDPFETNDLLLNNSENSNLTRGLGGNWKLLRQIQIYMDRQLAKGHVYPAIPGDISGKLYTRLVQQMYMVYGKSVPFYYQTGRVVRDLPADKNYVGSVG